MVEAGIARPERPKSAPPESNILITEQEHKKALWNGGFSAGWQEVSPEEHAAILDVGTSMKAAKAEWTQRHRSTAVNHFMRFLKRKELSVEQLLLEDVGTQEGAKRASTLIKLFLFYLSHTIQAKLGVGLGPASTTTTYARGAITFVAEKLEDDFEMEKAERWRKLCQKITKEYEPGRETQLIAIRGVRIVRHKATIGMNEIQMFLKCREVWRTIRDKRIILKYENMLIDLFLNGHRRGEICPHNFSGYRNLSRADAQFFHPDGRELTSYAPPVLLELSKIPGSYLWVNAPPTSKGDPRGEIWSNRGNGNAHPFGEPGCLAERMLNQEIVDPVPDVKARKETAYINQPGSKLPFRAEDFSSFVMKLIVEMCKLFFKMTITEEQARQIYGLHSFRVGLVVALMKLGASDNTIQVTGRWASKAFEVYRRPDAAVSMIVSATVASTENSSHSVAARAAGIPSLSRTSNENMLALQQVGQQTTQSEPIIAVGPNMSIVLPRVEEVEARKKAKDEVAEEEWQSMMDSVSTQELAVSQDRAITKENWSEVIPEGRRLRK